VNGRTVHFTGIDMLDLNASGKIKALWGFWNPTTVFAELNG
jgi:hypothetical protein